MIRAFRFRLFLVALCQLAVQVCHGQYYFKTYQTKNGLPHNSVGAVFQDSRGFIWAGTRSGICRFDGYTFKSCKNQHDPFGNIGNNVVTAIAEDKVGMLWVCTEKGLFKYSPYTDDFSSMVLVPGAYVSNLVVDERDDLWFIARATLHRYSQQQQKTIDYGIKASSIALDKENHLWIGDRRGNVTVYDAAQHCVLKKISVIDNHVSENARIISVIFPIDHEQVLIGCFGQGLKYYNSRTGVVKTLPLLKDTHTNIFVRDISASNSRDYWIGTESGIFVYNLATGVSEQLHKRADDPYAIPDNAVYAICRDNEGGMWVGTYFGGLSYCSVENARFKKYIPLSDANSISGNVVREICPDNRGNLWIGTEDNGVNKLQLNTGKFIHFGANGGTSDISYPNIHGLLAVDNQLLIGPFHRGMEIMDQRTGQIKKRLTSVDEPDGQTDDFIICMYRTSNGAILVGTAYDVGSGLFNFDLKYNTFERVMQIPAMTHVFSISEDHRGYIWVGTTTAGVYYYHPQTGDHGNIRFERKSKPGIAGEFPVAGILEDKQGCLWFTLEGGGLIRLSADRRTWKKITTADGLPTNVLYHALEDDFNRLWISSLKGLICFDKKTAKLRVYTEANGLITDQFNFNSAYKAPSGQMYFGSVKGMISFDPRRFNQVVDSPPVFITGFFLDNDKASLRTAGQQGARSVQYTDTLMLNYDQNNFSIEFAALNYSSPEATRYEYFMEGLDKNPTDLNSNRRAYFTNLSPGRYRFIVHAKSNTGNWTGRERLLLIFIRPPYWRSNIAYVFYVLCFVGIAFGIFRTYHGYIDRKNKRKLSLFEHEKEKEVYEAKIEFFTHIAHEIQTPLTLILSPIGRIIRKTKQTDEHSRSLQLIDKNARRLAHLTGQLLDFRKTEMHQFGLNFVNTNIGLLLQELVEQFEQEARDAQINLLLELPEHGVVAFADAEALTKICNNLLSNAIKYAATNVTVSLLPCNNTDTKFFIRFYNDGPGIPHELEKRIFEPFFRIEHKGKPGTGIGLSLARSLAELHNGSLSLVSSAPDAVVFEVALPIHQSIEFNLGSWTNLK